MLSQLAWQLLLNDLGRFQQASIEKDCKVIATRTHPLELIIQNSLWSTDCAVGALSPAALTLASGFETSFRLQHAGLKPKPPTNQRHYASHRTWWSG